MRWFNNLERKLIPTIRLKKWYKVTKFILAVPFILPVYFLRTGLSFLIKKVKIKRTLKPDIVLQNIVDGWANLIIPDPVVEEIAIRRASICSECPFAKPFGEVGNIITSMDSIKQIRGVKCSECGCPLSAKVRSKNDSCPRGLW